MIENVVQKAMSDAMQPNYFIVRAVQNSLIQDLLASFNCVICQNVAQPAVMVGTCCESVLGCQPCIDTWFQSHTYCPKCREEDGASKTSVLRGFDDALAKATTRFQRNWGATTPLRNFTPYLFFIVLALRLKSEQTS